MKLFASRRCSSRSKEESTAEMLRWRMEILLQWFCFSPLPVPESFQVARDANLLKPIVKREELSAEGHPFKPLDAASEDDILCVCILLESYCMWRGVVLSSSQAWICSIRHTSGLRCFLGYIWLTLEQVVQCR